MHQLIDAFKGLFVAAESDGALAQTASFTLENVAWSGKLHRPEPMSHPVVDRHMATACANAGAAGSSTHAVAAALLGVVDRLPWRAAYADREDEPDMAALSRSLTATSIIGESGVLRSSKVAAGLSLQGPDTYYPPHAHRAEESYWIIGGSGDWKVGAQSGFAVEPGDSIYHRSGVRHAMQTNRQPMLAVWLWTSYLGSEVVIVRD